MSIHDDAGVDRRRFLAAAGAGLGGVSIATLTTACGGSSSPAEQASTLTETVLRAFKSHRLVGLGEAHDLQNHHDALEMLLNDPRLSEVIDDVVVEFGNALYQPVVDRFIAGESIADADLRPAWENTTQSPLETWDAPVYEQLYRTVRAVNWTRPAHRQIRVLLGDPPVDWAKVTRAGQLAGFLAQRDNHAAALVRREVLAKGHRALLCYGAAHLLHIPAKLRRLGYNLTGIIEQRSGERVYVIADLVPFAGDPGGLGTKLARYPRDTVIPTAGSWLGSVDAGLTIAVVEVAGSAQHPGKPFNPYCGVPLRSLQDAGIHLGPAHELTASRPNPAIYLDPPYWRELQRRNALQGNPVNLHDYRKDLPAQYPLFKPPRSAECR